MPSVAWNKGIVAPVTAVARRCNSSAAKRKTSKTFTLPPSSVLADPASEVSNFLKLPRLPVPPLEQTLSGYSVTCRGLLPLAAGSSANFSFSSPTPNVFFGVGEKGGTDGVVDDDHHLQDQDTDAPDRDHATSPEAISPAAAGLFSSVTTLEDGHTNLDAHLKALREFVSSPDGARAQKQLEEADAAAAHAQRYPHSYIEPIWDSGYLAYNGPSPINIAPAFGTQPILNFNFAAAKRVAADVLDQEATMISEGTRNMCFLGGLLAHSVLRWYCGLVHGGVAMNADGGLWDPSPLANDFGVSRIAGPERDYLFRAEPYRAIRHFTVLRDGQAYLVPLVVNGVPLSADDLAGRLMQLCSRGSTRAAVPVGALTTTNRRDWFASSRALEKQHPRNREYLGAIEESLFVLCLDHNPIRVASDAGPAATRAQAQAADAASGKKAAAGGLAASGNEHQLTPNDLQLRHMLLGVGDDVFNRWFNKHNIILRPFTADEHAERLRAEQEENFPVAAPTAESVPPSFLNRETLAGGASFSVCFEHAFNDGLAWSKWIHAVYSDISALCAAESTARPDALGRVHIPKQPSQPDAPSYWRTTKNAAANGGFPLVALSASQRARVTTGNVDEKDDAPAPGANGAVGDAAAKNGAAANGAGATSKKVDAEAEATKVVSDGVSVPSNAAYLPLEFLLGGSKSEPTKAAQSAVARHLRACNSLKIKSVVLPQFGKSICKARWGLGPDALTQAALHLAYARLHGVMAPTYEACSTNACFHGRTETIRSATPQMRNFVAAMLSFSSSFVADVEGDSCDVMTKPNNGAGASMADAVARGGHYVKLFSATPEQRDTACQLLHAAAAAHVAQARKCAAGHGIDRHLLALKGICNEQRNKLGLAFFSESFYEKSGTWMLSTSNVSAPAMQWFNFGPVTEHGYGVGYVVREGAVHVGVTSFGQSRLSDAYFFSRVLSEAATDVALVLQNKPTEDKY